MFHNARQMLGAFAAVFEPGGGRSSPARWEVRMLVVLLLASVAVRFWGLGNVGLHPPDEDTVALPAVHLAQQGEPLFPSGMYYARAIVQTYLVAGSISVFGNSETALRLPSAVCGVLVVLMAFFVGRRFLEPVWNTAFVSGVAFLPELVMQSQNARMYIFLVACIAAYLLCIFAWERSNRTIYVIGALAAMILGLQFQALMIFTALLLLYPGLVQANPRKLWIGAIGVAVSLLSQEALYHWVVSFYSVSGRDDIARALGVSGETSPASMYVQPFMPYTLLIAAESVAALAAALVWRQVQDGSGRVASGVLVFLGMTAQFLFNYHIAALLLVAGTVVALRNRMRSRFPLWFVGGICLAAAVAHVIWLNVQDFGPRGVIFEAMVGRAAIWSFVNYIPVSYGATVLSVAGAGLALWRVAQGRRIPEVWLFVLLGVWAPLFLIGCFDRFPEYRYMTPVLLPLLIAAFATIQWVTSFSGDRTAREVRPWIGHLLAVCSVAIIVNPFRLAAVVNPDYGIYPDHKGAAAHLKAAPLQPGDIVVVEDVITHTYYLGRVDYWLTDLSSAFQFGRVINGEVRDIYTDTRMIVKPEQLESVLAQQTGGDLYVVGTGEGFVNGRPWHRGPETEEMLSKLQVVYEGRDGLTKVWKRPSARSQ